MIQLAVSIMNTARGTETHPSRHRKLHKKTEIAMAMCETAVRQCGAGPGNCEKCVSWKSDPQLRPLRLAKALQHRFCTTPGAAACSAPSAVDSSLAGGPQNKISRKTRIWTHIINFAGQCFAFMFSWTLLRPRSMPDACTRFANTGD